MIVSRLVSHALPFAAVLCLTACGQAGETADADPAATSTETPAAAVAGAGTIWNDGQKRPLSLQVAHPNGVVLQVNSIQSGDIETRVGLRVTNGRDRDIDLNRWNNNRDGYLLLGSGEKFYLSPPPTNTRLTVPAGQTFEGELVFLGRLPQIDAAILVLNENSTRDSEYTTTPGFRVDLPLGAAPASAPAAGAAQ